MNTHFNVGFGYEAYRPLGRLVICFGLISHLVLQHKYKVSIKLF